MNPNDQGVHFGPGYPPGPYGPPPGGPPPGGFGPPPAGGYGGPPPFGGPPGGYPPGPPGGPMGLGPMGVEPSTGLAIGSLVCGILSIPGACCCYGGIPLGIAAGVMGGIAMSRAKNLPYHYGGRGMAIGGLVCGLVGAIITFVLLALGMGMQLMQALQK